MSNEQDKNYISVGNWMLLLFLFAIPCAGVVAIIILALTGENETRKNYCRALIAWFLVLVAIGVAIALLGLGPEIQKHISNWKVK
jgi:hypothetical protein